MCCRARWLVSSLSILVASVAWAGSAAWAQSAPAANAAPMQAQRDAAFAAMLSSATLEGNFTFTGPGRDPKKVASDKYTLGDVKKLDDKLWLIPARIQYDDKDFQLPFTLKVEWAVDTPLIVVDNLGLPGFGTVSARVMFFKDHYAGYWQHGDAGGHLFGVVHRAKPAPTATGGSAD